MNLPNKITLSRIFLAFIFMFFLFCRGVAAKYAAFFTFVLACLTDLIDGRIARQKHLENDFGRLMDPIADKILILAAFLAFVELKIIPGWMVIIVIFREFVITGLRIIAATRGKVFAAEMAGKQKIVSQMLTIITILIFLIIRESEHNIWNPVWEIWFKRSAFYLMLVTVVMTLISGISYLVAYGRHLFTVHEKHH